MFYIPGWRPITELYGAVIYTATRRLIEDQIVEPGKHPVMELLPLRADAVNEVLAELRNFKALLPNGSTLDVSRSLVTGLEVLQNRHIDISVGTIGSGSIRDDLGDEDPLLQRLELEKRYGFLLGCPVVVDRNELDEVLRAKYPWHKAGLDVGPEQEAVLTEVISKSDQSKRPRGRPKHGDGLIEQMVHKHFGPRLAPGGDLYGVKKDAVEDEAIAWVKKQTCDLLEVSKTVIGGYLKPLYSTKDGGN